jgi:hypothetical protein
MAPASVPQAPPAARLLPRPVKGCLKRPSLSSTEGARANQKRVRFCETLTSTLEFVSPYEKDNLDAWFYSEEDFEDFAITCTHIMPSPAVLLISEDSFSEGHKRKRRAVHRILHSDADLAAAVHTHGFSSGCAANALRPNWNGV